MTPERVFLYRAPSSVCDADRIAEWLGDRIGATVRVRDRFLDEHGTPDLAESFARARVLNPYDRETGSTMYGILRYEERVLDDPERGGGVLYDGLALQRALNGVLPEDERSLETLHLPLLDRVFGTWGAHDGRWHKRIAVLGQPALLSVPGLSEAPAKPEEYYRQKQQSAMVSGEAPPREVLEGSLEADVIREADPRTTEAMQGYALAAYHFVATGEGFCEEPTCRLSDPHHHEDLIRAQFEAPAFCEEHEQMYG